MAFNTSLTDLKRYVRMSNSTDVDIILGNEPVIIQQYLTPIFGSELISEIESWSTETGLKETVYKNTCNLLAKLCFRAFIPELEVQASDSGLLRHESTNAKTAYSGQVNRLESSLEEKAFVLIDSIVEIFFSDSLLSANWTNTPVYIASLNQVFQTAKQFAKIVQLDRPYQAYISLQQIIRTWTYKSLKKRFNTDVVTTVLGTSNNENVLLFLDNIRAAIAYRTIFEASFQNLVQLDSSGVKFVFGGNTNSYKSEAAGISEHISSQQRNFLKNYEMHLSECDSLVENHPSDFGTTPAADVDNSDKQFYA